MSEGVSEEAASPPPDLKTELHENAPDRRTWILVVFVLALTFAAYAGTLLFQFVYDDRGQIVRNPHLRAWRFVPGFFTHRVWSHAFPHILGNYYRPIFLLWFRMNYAIFGPHPMGWHFTTIAVHVTVTLAVYRLGLKLTNDAPTAVLTALIFGLHPVHIESVAWISGVTDPLLALLLIPSFLCYLNWRDGSGRRGAWRALSLLLYAFAMLAKETALILPIVIGAYEWIWGAGGAMRSDGETFRLRVWKVLKAVTPYLLLTAAYLPARAYALHGIAHNVAPLSLATIIFTWPSILWFYFRHLVWPVGLSVFYNLPHVTHPGLINCYLPAAGVVAVWFFLWVWWRKLAAKSPLQSRTVQFACVWMVAPILPLLDLSVLPKGEVAHDRYLYLSSIGIALIAAIALRHIRLWKGTAYGVPMAQVVVALPLALALGIATTSQDLYWANDYLLYSRGVHLVPTNSLSRTNLASVLGELGQYQPAIKLYREVLSRDPENWSATYNLGYTYYRIGNLLLAEHYLRRAIALDVNGGSGSEFFYLGLTLLKFGHAKQAAIEFRRAIQIQPDGLAYHTALGLALKEQGDFAGALREFKSELANYPNETAARAQIEAIERGESAPPHK